MVHGSGSLSNLNEADGGNPTVSQIVATALGIVDLEIVGKRDDMVRICEKD